MSNPIEPKQSSKIIEWFGDLDRILRGKVTRPADVQTADIQLPIVRITSVIIMLAVVFGFCMGVFALVRGVETGEYSQALMQVLASMAKVPLLYLLTLVVTFPSLYVFNALVGSQLKMYPVLKLLIASLAVNLAVLASMGPILAFFSVSTPNYNFIVLLNVVVFAIAGTLGLVFLVQTLNRLSEAQRGTLHPDTESRRQLQTGSSAEPKFMAQNSASPSSTTEPLTAQVADTSAGPLDRLQGVPIGQNVRTVFGIWIMVFGLVGAQMGWVLRPFIGSPDKPFQFFRARDSNFFEAVWSNLVNFVTGG